MNEQPPDESEEARLAAPLLEEVFGGATRRFRAQLASRTGLDSPVHVAAVSHATLERLCTQDTYADAALWCSFHITGAHAPAYTLVEGRLLARLMGRLFGEGDVEATESRARGVTEVERVIGARMCRELIEAVCACWAGSEPLVMRPGAVARSRRICADVDSRTPYAITTLELGGSVPHGCIFVALPATAWEAVAPPPPVAPAPAPRKGERTPRFERLMPVQVEMVVELARLELPLRRLQGLRVGDEIPLGAVGEACGRVGDRKAFFGEPGTSGGVRSFRIARRVDSSSSN